MEADYVVVGGGAAGCAIAGRLAAPGRSVVLVEVGDARDDALTQAPGGGAWLAESGACVAPLYSEPDPTLGGRRTRWATARGLGGGSLLDDALHLHGEPAAYDAWAATGAGGWAWTDVAPVYAALEGRPTEGGVPIEAPPPALRPLAERFLDAAVGTGLDAAALAPLTLAGGRRWNVARTYLGPHRREPHLTRLTRTRVLRLQLDGARCIGVFARRLGREIQVRARREVILAAGTFGSPRLLQLAGIGAPGLLEAAGLRVVHALPGVGANLSDHLGVPLALAIDGRTPSSRDRGPWGALRARARWAAGGGVLAAPPVLATASLKSAAGRATADLHVRFGPGAHALARDGTPCLHPESGVTATVYAARPRARGRVHVTGADPDAPLRIEHLALIDADELARLANGLRGLRRTFESSAFAPLARGLLAPPDVFASDAALERHVRATAVSQYHAVGTCRLGGADDPDAVVDPRLRVRGLKGLRIADASVLPFAPGASPRAATLLVAERAVRFVVEDEDRRRP